MNIFVSFFSFPSCGCNTPVNCLRLGNPEKMFSLHLHSTFLTVMHFEKVCFIFLIVHMCLCVGVGTGTHRDKKRALDDPGPGGCALADESWESGKCSNHRAISPETPHEINTKLETP